MTPSEQNGTTRPSASASSPRPAGKAASAGKASGGKKPAQPKKRPARGKGASPARDKGAGTTKEAPEAVTAPPAAARNATEPPEEALSRGTEALAPDGKATEPPETAVPATKEAGPVGEETPPVREEAPPAGEQAPPGKKTPPVATQKPAAREQAPANGTQKTPARAEAPEAGTPAPAPREEAAPSAGPTRPGSGWRDLLRPRASARHLLVAVLCAALGFGVVTQIRQTHDDALSGMRQDDLVRLLDELTRRNHELDQEQEQLRSDLAELRSSTSSREAAAKAAAEQARVQGVLAGTLPVQGPGVRVTIQDPAGEVRAQTLVKILEELRNAGAEAVELSGQRLTASSWILDASGEGVVVDGTTVRPPYEWTAIGDPHTISVALDIPGGALASVRNAGGRAQMTESDDLQITAVRELEAPKHATPAPSKDNG
ncbi:DUF881 domain-containing protein [Georgenia thermotolerans]|nr:DUF881 domain-containing protein [Georgenia thermotolerans]